MSVGLTPSPGTQQRFQSDAIVQATTFDMTARKALSGIPQAWTEQIVGKPKVVQSLMTTYPVDVSSPGFRRQVGDEKEWRRIGEIFIRVSNFPGNFDGPAAKLEQIQDDAFQHQNWLDQIPAMMAAGDAIAGNNVADDIMNLDTIVSWESVLDINGVVQGTLTYVASATHPVNPLKTSVGTPWPNLYTTMPLTVNNLIKVRADARARQAPGVGQFRQDGPFQFLLHDPSNEVRAQMICKAPMIQPAYVNNEAGKLTTAIPNEALGMNMTPVCVQKFAQYPGLWALVSFDPIGGAPFDVLDKVPISPIVPAATIASYYAQATPAFPYEMLYEGPGSQLHIAGDPAAGFSPGWIRVGFRRQQANVWKNPGRIIVCWPNSAPRT